jgi:hypothetical protein
MRGRKLHGHLFLAEVCKPSSRCTHPSCWLPGQPPYRTATLNNFVNLTYSAVLLPTVW